MLTFGGRLITDLCTQTQLADEAKNQVPQFHTETIMCERKEHYRTNKQSYPQMFFPLSLKPHR